MLGSLIHPSSAAEWRRLILIMLAWDLLTLGIIWGNTQR